MSLSSRLESFATNVANIVRGYRVEVKALEARVTQLEQKLADKG